jgi:hypothetical protein
VKQKHECENWELGRAVSFLGIFVSNFLYSVFAVYLNTVLGRKRSKREVENVLISAKGLFGYWGESRGYGQINITHT